LRRRQNSRRRNGNGNGGMLAFDGGSSSEDKKAFMMGSAGGSPAAYGDGGMSPPHGQQGQGPQWGMNNGYHQMDEQMKRQYMYDQGPVEMSAGGARSEMPADAPVAELPAEDRRR
jgi:hypothetical protein